MCKVSWMVCKICKWRHLGLHLLNEYHQWWQPWRRINGMFTYVCVVGHALALNLVGTSCSMRWLTIWKDIYEIGVLAQLEVVSCVGFLGKYMINFAGLHSDWLGCGQLMWAGILSLLEFCGVVQLKRSEVGCCFLRAGSRCVILAILWLCVQGGAVLGTECSPVTSGCCSVPRAL